jgi:hypothetical protein
MQRCKKEWEKQRVCFGARRKGAVVFFEVTSKHAGASLLPRILWFVFTGLWDWDQVKSRRL